MFILITNFYSKQISENEIDIKRKKVEGKKNNGKKIGLVSYFVYTIFFVGVLIKFVGLMRLFV